MSSPWNSTKGKRIKNISLYRVFFTSSLPFLQPIHNIKKSKPEEIAPLKTIKSITSIGYTLLLRPVSSTITSLVTTIITTTIELWVLDFISQVRVFFYEIRKLKMDPYVLDTILCVFEQLILKTITIEGEIVFFFFSKSLTYNFTPYIWTRHRKTKTIVIQ